MLKVMAKPKKPGHNPGRSSGRFSMLGIEISTSLKAALDRCSIETGRRKRWMIERAIEAYLRAEGYWPPPPTPPQPD